MAPSPARALLATTLAVVPWLSFAGCSSAPEHLPGGEAASKAAYRTGETYAKGLSRGIDRGKRDRASADLAAARRALEQYAADESEYPEAGSCADLFAALRAAGSQVLPERDPWGAPYRCRSTRDGYAVRSPGEDGVEGTGDDLAAEGGIAPLP